MHTDMWCVSAGHGLVTGDRWHRDYSRSYRINRRPYDTVKDEKLSQHHEPYDHRTWIHTLKQQENDNDRQQHGQTAGQPLRGIVVAAAGSDMSTVVRGTCRVQGTMQYEHKDDNHQSPHHHKINNTDTSVWKTVTIIEQ